MQYIPPINGDTGNPNRSYVNANPSLGVEGSIPSAEAFEHVIREVVNAITAAGLTPSGANLTQLAAAIAANSSPDATETVKGKVELATNAEALGGTDTTRAVTSAGLASSKSLTTNGYMKLPGGLIIQWITGTQVSLSTANINDQVLTYPVAFPTAFLCSATGFVWSSGTAIDIGIKSPTTTGCTLYTRNNSSSGSVVATPYLIVIGY